MGRKPKDLTDQVFGKLKALEPTNKRHGSSIIWKCQCSCDGKIVEVAANSLTSGNTKSCGCSRYGQLKSREFEDLAGRDFGLLTAFRPTEKRDTNGCLIWECICSCDGKIVEKSSFDLKRGHAKSCGCLQKKAVSANIKGRTFGQLKAIQPTQQRSQGHVVWLCQCVDCGNEMYVTANHLLTGNAKRCMKCGYTYGMNEEKGDV